MTITIRIPGQPATSGGALEARAGEHPVFSASPEKRPQAARESTEFQHKAIHALAADGFPRASMAGLMGISIRSVRRYLNTPCPAYVAEMAGRAAREAEVERLRHVRAVTPFIVPGEEVSPARSRVHAHRERIREELARGLSQAAVGRLLGISRRMVHYHLQGGQIRARPLHGKTE